VHVHIFFTRLSACVCLYGTFVIGHMHTCANIEVFVLFFFSRKGCLDVDVMDYPVYACVCVWCACVRVWYACVSVYDCREPLSTFPQHFCWG